MSKNNNLLLAGIVFSSIAGGLYIKKNYFDGKSKEEIDVMISNAFDKLHASVRLVSNCKEILEKAFYNLKNGYVNLDIRNITKEDINRLQSIAHDINTITNNAPKIQESLGIIEEAIQLIAIPIGEAND